MHLLARVQQTAGITFGSVEPLHHPVCPCLLSNEGRRFIEADVAEEIAKDAATASCVDAAASVLGGVAAAFGIDDDVLGRMLDGRPRACCYIFVTQQSERNRMQCFV